jgi:hypothetical protein
MEAIPHEQVMDMEYLFLGIVMDFDVLHSEL